VLSAYTLTKPFIGAVGLYRLSDDADVRLYIGIGSNPEVRWKAHAKTDWWADVAKREVAWFGTWRAARRAEIQAIWDENPVHNTVRVNPMGLPELHDDEHAAELPVGDFKLNATDVCTRVRLLGDTYLLTTRGKGVAAVVPIELGRLIRRAGGADAAAEILADHLGVDMDEIRDQGNKAAQD
jgi:antitoxin (DNA-binding transcriptional repressor) of toxin-antitoxin stability system/predicted GIY-YIG superfamily endonuclease